MDSPPNKNEVAQRLVAVRVAIGVERQNEMAKLLGATTSQYNNWETGAGLIPVAYALRFKAHCGVTLDYIYAGDRSGLPLTLASMLPVKAR